MIAANKSACNSVITGAQWTQLELLFKCKSQNILYKQLTSTTSFWYFQQSCKVNFCNSRNRTYHSPDTLPVAEHNISVQLTQMKIWLRSSSKMQTFVTCTNHLFSQKSAYNNNKKKQCLHLSIHNAILCKNNFTHSTQIFLQRIRGFINAVCYMNLRFTYLITVFV